MASHLLPIRQEKFGTLSLNSVRGTTLSLVLFPLRASLVAQLIKNLPSLWETWVQSLGWEDPLEKGTLSTPIFCPGEFHGQRSPWIAGTQQYLLNQIDSATFLFSVFFFLIFIYLAVSSLSCDTLGLSRITQDLVACRLSSCGTRA